MSRHYPGAYRVLVVLDGNEYGMTDPASYEDCERACLAFGLGVPYERRRVVRALIVPVSGAHAAEPGTDFVVEGLA